MIKVRLAMTPRVDLEQVDTTYKTDRGKKFGAEEACKCRWRATRFNPREASWPRDKYCTYLLSPNDSAVSEALGWVVAVSRASVSWF